jgi:predicted methyltransferase
MIDIARGDHPGLRFEVGSMTDLDLADSSLAGLVAWYSLIHIPDDEIGRVFAQFRRVLRPGGLLVLTLHVGDESRLMTQGYGHPMKVYVHRRQPGQVAAWLAEAGFVLEAQMTLTSAESKLGAILFARQPGLS